MRSWWTTSLTRRERRLLLAALALALVVRITYIVLTRDHTLVGDEPEYDLEARFLADGKWFFSTTPFGNPHQTTWKSPGYGTFLGLVYLVVGGRVNAALVLQVLLLTPLLLAATYVLGRRLFSSEVGLVAVFVVAVYPATWQYDVRLYSEALANPLAVAAFALLLTARRPALLGAVIGASLLIRPSSLFLLAGAAVAFLATSGLRVGSRQTAITVVLAVLVVAPWSIRNATLEGPWVPISLQSAALFGTFNDDAANDPDLPYKWRPVPRRDVDLFRPENRINDGELYRELNTRAFDYIKEHPASVPNALLRNGVQRLWDLRPPGQALDDTRYEGRTRSVTAVGLAMYFPLLLLALLGLRRLTWPQRWTIAALVVAACVVYLGDAGTRYRTPFEPLIVVLAVAALPLPRRLRDLLVDRPGVAGGVGPGPGGGPRGGAAGRGGGAEQTGQVVGIHEGRPVGQDLA